MRKLKVKSILGIALMLGLFLLGGTIFLKGIGAEPVYFDLDYSSSGPIDVREGDDQGWVDAEIVEGAVYLLGYLLDDDGNEIGYVNITGGVRLESDGRYYVYGSADAGTFGDYGGTADVSGQLLDRPVAHDANPNGTVDLGPWGHAGAWDSFYSDELPSGSASGQAELTVDCVTISIGLDISG